ncbi:MAG TPA: recombinase family protein [Chloroflexota bacterium]|nr:recombinase family protein [Chloroflexota bacterium]
MRWKLVERPRLAAGGGGAVRLAGPRQPANRRGAPKYEQKATGGAMKKRVELREIRKVALSVRLSDENEAKYSLRSQEDDLTEWARAEGWEVVGVYVDPDASAWKTVANRGEFIRMIEDAEAGKFDAVLVLKSDRWMRGVGFSAIYRERLFAAGVHYKSLEEPGAWDGSLGGFLLGSLADTFAEYYSLDLSIKVIRGWKARADSGLTLGDVPFGYSRDDPDHPIRPQPVEAVVVLMIFEWYASGVYSMDQLADELNSRGFCPRSKQGKVRFSKASVQGMLKNPVYAGYVTRHGEILGRGLHEAIVQQDLFERVQRMIAVRARKPRSYSQRPPFPYLIAGIAHCASCGGSLWANGTNDGRYRYYRCAARQHGEVCVDGGISTAIGGPEAVLAEMFEHMRLPETWQERVRVLTLQDEDQDSIQEQERYWQRQVVRAKEGFRAELLDATQASAMKREAEDHLRELQSLQSSVAIASAPILTDMCEAWPLLTQEERRDAIRIILADVSIDVRHGDVKGLRPADSFAPLFQTVAESGGAVGFCDWRPRADSNPRPMD